MRKVVDTNFLQDKDLRAYLAASHSHIAIVPDYTELEMVAAGKDNVIKSTSILADYPKQVVLGKQTSVLATMRGRRKGIKKRFSDGKRTTTFRRWAQRGRRKLERGDLVEQARFDRAREGAAEHLEAIKRGADGFAADLEEAAKQFADEELRRLRNKEPFTEEMIGKIHDRIFHFATGFFATQGMPLPPWQELMHTYIFRFSICATMHALRWIAVGGAKKVGKDRIRNDIIDASIVAQALCFDGLLSKDAMAQEIYDNSVFILKQFLAFAPRKHRAATVPAAPETTTSARVSPEARAPSVSR